jgi:serine/threonine protein kinase
MVMLSNLFICFIKRKRGPRPPAIDHASEIFDINPEDYPSCLFPYEDLKASTRNFSKAYKIGEGAFGAVYKGALRDGSDVAVKELPANIKQGNQEFINEVQLITGLQHKNLVKLCGCAISGSNRLLVYEYVENKSLAQALFDPGRALVLEWPFRYNIALGLAQGLAFLHSRGPERLAHGDIKANNVLLDRKLAPKIADFGLARMCQNNERKVLTRIEGKRGYVAPEFALHGQLTSKADVFSFGIIALELVSGRESMKSHLPPEEQYLLLWAWNLYEAGRVVELVDPRVRDACDEEQARLLIKVALMCSQGDSAARPHMSRVVALLSGDADLPDDPERPAFLGIGVSDPNQPTSRPNSITTWK